MKAKKRLLIAVLGPIIAVALAFICYIASSLVAVATYPDARRKPAAESVRPGKEYNVRRSRNDLSGVNLGLALQAPREGGWGVVLNEKDIDAVQKAGFRYVRVQVSFLYHLTRVGDDYQLDPKLLARLDWVIKSILRRGMTAVIDLYNLVPDEKLTFSSSEDKRQMEDQFLAVWRIVARRYRDYPKELYFELANEPHRPVTASLWNEYVSQALKDIRSSGGGNKARTVVVGVPIRIGWIIRAWDQVNGIEDLRLPSAAEDPNLMVTFHYYNPYAFTYQGQTYNRDLKQASQIWKGNYWTSSERQRAYVRKDLDKVAAWARKNGRRLILGEFGASVYADLGSQARWTGLVREEAEARDIAWIFWDFYRQDKLGSLYDQSTGAWRKPILDALLPAPVK
jgi:endoglucanase